MNVQKIFKALEEDSEDRSLGIVCQQLEQQGYFVLVNGKLISSAGFFENEYTELESLSQVDISLKKGKKIEQEFSVEFIGPHEIAIMKKTNV